MVLLANSQCYLNLSVVIIKRYCSQTFLNPKGTEACAGRCQVSAASQSSAAELFKSMYIRPNAITKSDAIQHD